MSFNERPKTLLTETIYKQLIYMNSQFVKSVTAVWFMGDDRAHTRRNEDVPYRHKPY